MGRIFELTGGSKDEKSLIYLLLIALKLFEIVSTALKIKTKVYRSQLPRTCLKYLGHEYSVYGYDGSFDYTEDSSQEVLVIFNGCTAHFLLRYKDLSLFIVHCPTHIATLSNGLSCP